VLRYRIRVNAPSSARVLGLLVALVAAASSCGGEETPPPAGTTPPAATTPGTSSGDPAPPPATTGTTAPVTPGPAAPTCTGREKLAGDLEWTINERAVHVHVPAAYDPTKGVPVVLDFHGYSSNGTQQASYAGMIAKSDAAGFVAVHAEGTGIVRGWNAGACCGTAASSGTKDVELVGAIIDELAKKLCLDDKRVFSTGLSNGGFLSHRLACEMSSRIAAIAPVAGVLGIPTCTPARAVPVMQFHGTSDTLVPYAGNATYPSVPDTIAKWATLNECKDAAHETFKKDDVQCMTQSQCKGSSEVTLCTVTGGGHTWPGSSTDVSALGLGTTTQAINATDAMWEFFKKHPMP
jgi:polyhydroxybutyrate depolymerase